MSTPRLPFDPSKTAAAQRAADEAARRPAPGQPQPSTSTPANATAQAAAAPLSVSQLADRIAHALSTGVPGSISVVGEVSGFRERTHWYFDLKDAQAVVSCAMFANAARRAGFTPSNGQQVVVRGRIDFYQKAGKVTLLVDKVEPVGAGALDLAFRKLVEEVRALGWFAQERKRPVPLLPRRVGVVTSRSAAALQDVLVTMRSRCPCVGVVLADVRVQGDVAPEITHALRTLSARAKLLAIDAIILTRGGGSAEDLFVFNDKELARAIVECSIPVVAAIGHETDTTIAELVADVRCATPTQAAMRVTPERAALERQLGTTASRLRSLALGSVRERAARVDALARSPLLAGPGAYLAARSRDVETHAASLRHAVRGELHLARTRVHECAVRLERLRPGASLARAQERAASLDARLASAARRMLVGQAARVDALERELIAVSPQRVLERGYSLTTRDDGALVRSAGDVRAGDRITTRLAQGEVASRVEGETGTSPSQREEPSTSAPRAGVRMPARRTRKATPDAGQGGLFDGA